MTADERLYDRSIKAAEKYWGKTISGMSQIARAVEMAKREAFRAGWMIGYRVGKRAKR